MNLICATVYVSRISIREIWMGVCCGGRRVNESCSLRINNRIVMGERVCVSVSNGWLRKRVWGGDKQSKSTVQKEKEEWERVLWPKSAIPYCRMLLKKGFILTNTIWQTPLFNPLAYIFLQYGYRQESASEWDKKREGEWERCGCTDIHKQCKI